MFDSAVAFSSVFTDTHRFGVNTQTNHKPSPIKRCDDLFIKVCNNIFCVIGIHTPMAEVTVKPFHLGDMSVEAHAASFFTL